MSGKNEITAYSEDSWESLKRFTSARIALGRAGTSIPTKALLDFKLAHAFARDAVFSTFDIDLQMAAISVLKLSCIRVTSRATDRVTYLQRPDLGRILSDKSAAELAELFPENDVAIIIADGLCANAINANCIPLLNSLIPLLRAQSYTIAPVCIAEQARVAIGDHCASLLRAKFSIVIIGERPGLSSTDSIGVYLTYNPKPGLTDDSRNCISNIRKEGLSASAAANKIAYLIEESFKRKISGITLKDDSRPQASLL